MKESELLTTSEHVVNPWCFEWEGQLGSNVDFNSVSILKELLVTLASGAKDFGT